MPHVIVKTWPGKSEDQKRRLADAITKDITDILECGEHSVSVAIAKAFETSDRTTIRWTGNAGFFINSRGTTFMIDPLRRRQLDLECTEILAEARGRVLHVFD